MARIITLYLPCEQISVRARIGYLNDLSTLEELVERAIRHGVRNIDTLSELFGISKRLMLDIIIDLWHAGVVAIDFGRNTIYHIERGKTADKQRGLVGAIENRSMMYDLIAGHILPVMGDLQMPGSPLVIPVLKNRARIDDLNSLQLRSALERAINNEQRSGEPRRVIEAGLSFVAGNDAPPRRWLPITAEVRTGEGTYVRLNVLHHPLLPASIRRQISVAIERYVVDRPQEPFSERLAEHAATGPAAKTRVSASDALAALAKGVAAARTIGRHEIEERHTALRSLADSAAAAVEEARALRARVRILSGVEENRKFVQRLIKKAQWQLVLTAPFIRYIRDERRSLIDDLEDAVRRGVTVYLLWGMRRGAATNTVALDENVKNAILRINESAAAGRDGRPRGKILTSKTSAGTHAKIVIQDNEAALVTSFNFLDPSSDNVGEVGALITPAHRGITCEAIIDLLRWSRENFPDYDVAQTIGTVPPQWSNRPGGRREADAAHRPDVLPHRPPPPTPKEGGGISEVAAAAWVLTWQAYAEEIQQMADIGTMARLLRDGEHRAFFDLALGQARRRLIITSDQISPEALTADRISQLLKLARSGVAVRLLYRTPLRRDEALGKSVIDSLLAEAAALPVGRFKIIKAQNHAKVLVFDDTAVVSSFNFLSLAGKFLSPVGTRRESSEIGVLLSGGSAANKVLEAVNAIEASALADVLSLTVPGVAPKPAARHPVYETAVRLARHATGNDEAALRDALREAAQPWESLDEFEDVHVSESALLAAAEVALAERGVTPSDPSASRWIARLATQAWREGDAVAALTFAVASGQTQIPGLPSCPVIALTAAGPDGDLVDRVLSEIVALRLGASGDELGDFGALFASAPSQDAETSALDWFAVTAAALAEFIVRGSEPAASTLDLFKDAMPDIWADLVARTLAAGESGVAPFPFKALASSRPHQQPTLDPEQMWTTLVQEMDHAEGKFTQYMPANHAWRFLYQDNQALGTLKAIAARRDPTALKAWREAHSLANAQEFLHMAIVAVTGWSKATVIGAKVRTYLRSLSKIDQAISDILSSMNRLIVQEEEIISAGRVFASQVAASFEQLNVEAERALQAPGGRLVQRALGVLQQVVTEGAK